MFLIVSNVICRWFSMFVWTLLCLNTVVSVKLTILTPLLVSSIVTFSKYNTVLCWTIDFVDICMQNYSFTFGVCNFFCDHCLDVEWLDCKKGSGHIKSPAAVAKSSFFPILILLYVENAFAEIWIMKMTTLVSLVQHVVNIASIAAYLLICLGGCIGWALDSWSKGRWFDSRPGRYQVN